MNRRLMGGSESVNEYCTTDFSDYDIDVEGVEVSDDGYYTCESCDSIVHASYRTKQDESGRNRGLWVCSDCDSTFWI